MAKPTRMTVAEIAAQNRVTQRTVRGWIASGRLKVIRAGRRVLVTPAALAEFLRVPLDRPDLVVASDRHDLVPILARHLVAMADFQDRIAVIARLVEMSCIDLTEDEVQEALCDLAVSLEIAAGRAISGDVAWVEYRLDRR